MTRQIFHIIKNRLFRYRHNNMQKLLKDTVQRLYWLKNSVPSEYYRVRQELSYLIYIKS